jgi:hypothetical protein
MAERQRVEQRTTVPDGVLVGGLAVLVLLPTSVWIATEVAGWFAHGHWPSIGFTAAALSLKHLASDPGGYAAAWPRRSRPGLLSAARTRAARAARRPDERPPVG